MAKKPKLEIPNQAPAIDIADVHRQQGQQARAAGLAQRDCPFDAGDSRRTTWLEGWAS